MTPVTGFVVGMVTAGYVLAGIFFLNFWRRTRDSLFLVFALAFWLMALNQALPVLLGIPREEQGGIYLLRLAAFVLIIAAILRKNMAGRGSS
ncbi:MAG TPA: DUF5985 family protein [Caulobacteraceae bacterium]|nr:DUF5985 family protein [Caulobacteraceae bacterium]